MFKDEVLENERRRKIYSAIEANPGIHLRQLQRVLDVPLATLEYHLGYMTRKKIIFSETESHHRRYYTKTLDSQDKKILSALRSRRMREIVLAVLKSKKAKYQWLSQYFSMPNSTLSTYLKYLVDHDVLVREKVGYENIYTVRDEESIAKVLIAYKTTFLDTLVDKALSTWMETYFRQEDIKSA